MLRQRAISLAKLASRAPSGVAPAQAAGERLLRPFMGFSSPFQPPPAKTFRDFKVMGYLPEQIYDVVADIDNYDRFVPWCIQSRIVSQSAPGTVDAELTVGFHMISESYISHVTFHPGNSIRSRVGSSALFHHLNNTWEFAPGPRPGTTALTFYVDFAFKSALYSEVTNIFFDQVVSRMMAALEGRCREVYGPPNES